jgi:ABC-type dipeptide/oligopeptide/nickel transport system permease subunit
MSGSPGAGAAALDEPAGRATGSARRRGLRQRLRGFTRRRLTVVGAVLVALEVLLALLAPRLAPYPPNALDFASVLQPPSRAHWLGTDDLGRDILSRLLFGARISLGVGVVAVLLAIAVGVPLGLVVGYVGRRLDEVVMRVVDSLMSLPPLVLALTITAVLGAGIQNAMIAIAIVAIPTYTRLMRGQVLSVREHDYIRAIVACGAATPRILFRHVLPNSVQPIIVQGTLGVGFAIITESSLSFIGLGAQPPTATWGSMVQVGFQHLETSPWFVLAPALVIFVAVLGFNVLGDGLRDALDPTLRP